MVSYLPLEDLEPCLTMPSLFAFTCPQKDNLNPIIMRKYRLRRKVLATPKPSSSRVPWLPLLQTEERFRSNSSRLTIVVSIQVNVASLLRVTRHAHDGVEIPTVCHHVPRIENC